MVFHYNCENCNDEQVSYEWFNSNFEIDDLIDYIEEYDILHFGLECTNCDKLGTTINLENLEIEIFTD